MEDLADFRIRFGAAVRYRRTELKISLVKAAKLVGSYPADLSYIERGVHLPRLDKAMRIAKVLGIKLDDFPIDYSPAMIEGEWKRREEVRQIRLEKLKKVKEGVK